MSGVFITKTICFDRFCSQFDMMMIIRVICLNKGNNKIKNDVSSFLWDEKRGG